jgi:hypothetical protein
LTKILEKLEKLDQIEKSLKLKYCTKTDLKSESSELKKLLEAFKKQSTTQGLEKSLFDFKKTQERMDMDTNDLKSAIIDMQDKQEETETILSQLRKKVSFQEQELHQMSKFALRDHVDDVSLRLKTQIQETQAQVDLCATQQRLLQLSDQLNERL